MKLKILEYVWFHRGASDGCTNCNEHIKVSPRLKEQWISLHNGSKFAHWWDGVSWKHVMVEVSNRIHELMIGYSYANDEHIDVQQTVKPNSSHPLS